MCLDDGQFSFIIVKPNCRMLINVEKTRGQYKFVDIQGDIVFISYCMSIGWQNKMGLIACLFIYFIYSLILLSI